MAGAPLYDTCLVRAEGEGCGCSNTGGGGATRVLFSISKLAKI